MVTKLGFHPGSSPSRSHYFIKLYRDTGLSESLSLRGSTYIGIILNKHNDWMCNDLNIWPHVYPPSCKIIGKLLSWLGRSNFFKNIVFRRLITNVLIHCFHTPGGRYKSWKRRWFILNDSCLYYFQFTTVRNFVHVWTLQDNDLGFGGQGWSIYVETILTCSIQTHDGTV